MSVNISNALYEDGHEPILCATRKAGPLRNFLSEDIVFYCLNKKNSVDVVAFFKLLRIIKKHKITLIHAHSSSIFWAIGAKFFFSQL